MIVSSANIFSEDEVRQFDSGLGRFLKKNRNRIPTAKTANLALETPSIAPLLNLPETTQKTDCAN
jgi:hypothetical protein